MAAKESRPLPRLQVFILLFHSFHSFPSRRDDTRTVPIVPIGPRWNRIEKDFCVIFTNRFHSELQIFYGGGEGERGRMDRKSWIDRNRFLRIFLFFFLGKGRGKEEGRGEEGILPWLRWCQVIRVFEYDIRRKLWDFVRGGRERGERSK